MKDGPLSNPNGQEKSIVLICPGERPAVHALAQSAPLALVPILGKTLLEHWLDHLADGGVRHVCLLASDRPKQVRAWLGDGLRWELKAMTCGKQIALAVPWCMPQRAESGWASECVAPRSFSKTTPLWVTTNVLTPDEWYSAGYATNLKPLVLLPWLLTPAAEFSVTIRK